MGGGGVSEGNMEPHMIGSLSEALSLEIVGNGRYVCDIERGGKLFKFLRGVTWSII